ncbi:MAG: SET domain-containing protein-lysine N-methyltransferase [Ginsengibacter sp.]
MLLSKKHLFVKRSLLPHAGKGLFTKVFIAKETRVVEYTGRITTWKNVLQSEEFNAYVFYINRNHVIEAKNHLSSLGRYTNDANGIFKIKGLVNNTKYVNDKGRVFIQAIKDIPAGSEIFVSYRKEYWDVVRYNNMLRKRQRKKP